MIIVIDTGPLTHFAQAGILDTLRSILSPYDECVYPSEVFDELTAGATGDYPSNNEILRCSWLTLYHRDDLSLELSVAYFKNQLGGSGSTNLGEAACLAIADAHTDIVYLDDHDGRVVADQEGVPFTTTVDLLLDAVDEGLISRTEARNVVAVLLETGYTLPSWALSAFS